MPAMLLPAALLAARWLATRYIIRAATARAAAAGASAIAARSTPLVSRALVPRMIPTGVTSPGVSAIRSVAQANPMITYGSAQRLPLWVRGGQLMERGRSAISSARPISSVGREIAPTLSNRFARPTANIVQRVNAQPTISGKAGTLAFAPVRATVRAADAMAVPAAAGGLEYGAWSGLVGRARENQRQDGSAPTVFVNANNNADNSYFDEETIRNYRGIYGRPATETTPLRPSVFSEENVTSPSDLPPVIGTIPSSASVRSPRPAPTVTTTQEKAGLSEFEQARIDYERDLAGLNSGYQNMLAEIKSMYKLAETEEEKQQLRYTLSDLEDQFTAGKEAIANLYVEKTQTIQAIAAASRARTLNAESDASSVYSQAAIDLAALQEARDSAQIAGNRGLSIGPIQKSSYAGLLESMAPIAGQYARRIGDIGSEGIEYLAGLNEAMGAARQGELQSLYAASTATAGLDHARRVAERIANERLAKASAIQSIMGQQLSMRQSMAGRRPQSDQFSGQFTTSDINARIEEMAARTFDSPQNFANMFASEFGRAPTDSEWAYWEKDAEFYAERAFYEREENRLSLQALQNELAAQNFENIQGNLDPVLEEALRSLIEQNILQESS